MDDDDEGRNVWLMLATPFWGARRRFNYDEKIMK
jgi:hypothetical protein